MPRTVGTRIIAACSEVERRGVCSQSDVTAVMQIEPSNVGKYLSRAVGLGLLSIDRTTRPHSYAVIPGWRERIKLIARVKPAIARPVFVPVPVRSHHLQGIWA